MQREIFEILKKGIILNVQDVIDSFKCSRPHANRQLQKLEHSYDEIISYYSQEAVGNRIYSKKYYKYNYNI